MQKEKNIGMIEDTVAGKSFRLAGISNREGNLKKILIGENLSDSWVKQLFPQTEIVQDPKSILEDAGIDLVIISETQKDELNIVADIINTGKNVRIV